MEFLSELWLPILVSAVFVFVVSSVLHMVIPIHKGDQKKLESEDAFLEALRAQGVGPGAYIFPCAGSMKAMGTPEMIEKMKRGPVGWLTVLPPGGFRMGRGLVLWFVFCLIVGFFVAYVSWHALGAGAGYRAAFRIAGAAAVLAYAIGYFQDSVWKGVSWKTTAKFMFDGVIYALVTAGTFAWLWPDAA
jgi:hypothetical protein